MHQYRIIIMKRKRRDLFNRVILRMKVQLKLMLEIHLYFNYHKTYANRVCPSMKYKDWSTRCSFWTKMKKMMKKFLSKWLVNKPQNQNCFSTSFLFNANRYGKHYSHALANCKDYFTNTWTTRIVGQGALLGRQPNLIETRNIVLEC